MTAVQDGAESPADVQLLALLAYLRLAAFSRAAADAELAPDLAARSAMSRLAVRHHREHEALIGRLREAGVDPQAAMATFAPPVDAFHARTAPSDWPEAVLKSLVGLGVAEDVAGHLPVTGGGAGGDEAIAGEDFLAEALRCELQADPSIAGRLALWGRRVVGEGLSQAQRVAADRPDLADLITVDDPGTSAVTRVSAFLLALTSGYEQRVSSLGLTP